MNTNRIEIGTIYLISICCNRSYPMEIFNIGGITQYTIRGWTFWRYPHWRISNTWSRLMESLGPQTGTSWEILSLKLHKSFGSTLTLAALTSLSERSSFRWSSSASKEKAVETGSSGGAIAPLDFGRSVIPIPIRGQIMRTTLVLTQSGFSDLPTALQR